MADRVLFISWGTPVRGREERGLELFNENVGMYGRMQQDGRIEGFDVVVLAPNGKLAGYIEVHGSEEQLNALRTDDEHSRAITAASLMVDDLCMFDGVTGGGIADQLARYQEAISQVPQPA